MTSTRLARGAKWAGRAASGASGRMTGRRGDAAPLSIIEFTGTAEKADTRKPRKKKAARRDGTVESQRVAAAG